MTRSQFPAGKADRQKLPDFFMVVMYTSSHLEFGYIGTVAYKVTEKARTAICWR